LEERPKHRNTIVEEEQYKFETLTERLRCVWHTPQEVVEYYYQKHKAGKTSKTMLRDIREEVGEIEESNKKLANYLEETSVISDNIEEIIHQEERDKSKLLYDEEGLKITEYDMKRILEKYFEGTDLENIQFDWEETIKAIITNFKLPTYLLDKSKLFKIKLNFNRENILMLAIDGTNFLANVGTSVATEGIRVNNEQNRKFKKEIELRN